MSDLLPRAMFLTWVDDLSPAGWIVDGLHPFAQDVGSIVPPVFEAYARAFHPASIRVGEPGPLQQWRDVSWRTIADANGRVFHPEAQFGNLIGSWGVDDQPGIWDQKPRTGTLGQELAGRVLDALRPLTSTPETCWFAAWEGWGDFERRLPRGLPKIHVPGRAYFLATAPISAALQSVVGSRFEGVVDPDRDPFYQSASLWWPDDRVWCVATEIDFAWTYVGGSRACIDAVLRSPGIEALECHVTDGVQYLSDRINPPTPDDAYGNAKGPNS